MTNDVVHFHHSDDRFCGSRAKGREFTFDVDRVSCPKCEGKIGLFITEQGQQAIAEFLSQGARADQQGNA